MEHYVGLDVSLKLTAICIVDRTGKIEREGVVSSDPEAIAAFIKSHAPHVVRIGLETGATSTWLWTELNKMGLPVICIDARHAKAALKMQGAAPLRRSPRHRSRRSFAASQTALHRRAGSAELHGQAGRADGPSDALHHMPPALPCNSAALRRNPAAFLD